MPELPEVETIKNDLNQKIKGKKIVDLLFCDAPKMLKPSKTTLTKGVEGAIIKEVDRRAKLIVFYLSGEKFMLAHLKLTGRLLVREKGAPSDEWVRLIFKISDNKELRFSDLRKFGYVQFVPDEKELKKILSEYGVEPLGGEFTLQKLAEIFKNKGGKIKTVLMDQSAIAGIGNIYSDEILWYAGINPARAPKSLNPGEIKKLYCAIQGVLRAAVRARGSSIDTFYIDTAGKKGRYGDELRAYHEKKCSQCGGAIKRIKLGGRSGHYCPKCQK